MNTNQTTQTTLTNEKLDAALTSPLTHNADPELTHLHTTLADLRTTSEDVARNHFIHAAANAKPAPRFSFTLKAWSTLATAALLLGVFAPRLRTPHPQPPAQPAAIAVQQPAPEMSDEALLASVQDDLDASIPSPMLPLESSTSTKSTTQRNQK